MLFCSKTDSLTNGMIGRESDEASVLKLYPNSINKSNKRRIKQRQSMQKKEDQNLGVLPYPRKPEIVVTPKFDLQLSRRPKEKT